VTDKLEWWLDEASLPDVVWARLHVLPDGLLSPAEHDLFHAELRREVDVQHVLHGRPARPFLKRVDRDDVLFVMSAPVQLAVVHLTYTPTPPEHPPLPATVPYDRVWEFVDRTHREAEAG
jgi:hypothetical protein